MINPNDVSWELEFDPADGMMTAVAPEGLQWVDNGSAVICEPKGESDELSSRVAEGLEEATRQTRWAMGWPPFFQPKSEGGLG